MSRGTPFEYTPDDIVNHFSENPMCTSKDIAEEFGCCREAARLRLKTLVDRGRLGRTRVEKDIVYHLPELDLLNNHFWRKETCELSRVLVQRPWTAGLLA